MGDRAFFIKKSDPAFLRGPSMGEEKPDEELMGKRKSSPRLSPAPLGTGTIMVNNRNPIYTWPQKKSCFCFACECGNITPIHAGAVRGFPLVSVAEDTASMRVIAGQAKGRPLKAVPGDATRPTTDKVKEALFSMIGPFFDGERVLDLFAGTGGLGIEALSRGAGNAVFIDANARSIEVVRRNLDAVGMSGLAEVYRNDAVRAIKTLARKGAAFNLIFLDPPYAMETGDKLLELLAEQGLAADGAVAVLEHASSRSYPERFHRYERIKHAVYGEAALSIYRYSHTNEGESEK